MNDHHGVVNATQHHYVDDEAQKKSSHGDPAFIFLIEFADISFCLSEVHTLLVTQLSERSLLLCLLLWHLMRMENEILENDNKPPVDEFAKTATAAKLSGTFNETAGFLKRKFGEFTDDSSLKEEGRDQQLLGKIHHLVGTIRSVRESTVEKISKTRVETQAICRKHGGKLLDVASEFVEDMKKMLFK